VALQAGVYIVAGVAAYSSLASALVTPVPAAGAAGGATTGSNAFREAHPMVYGGEGAAAGDVVAHAKPKAE
jgi:hypothetical protein